MTGASSHIRDFKVTNFKRFESFEMKGLGQFNLVVGDNNVGKTSVLEALLVDEEFWNFRNNLLVALSYRNLKEKYSYKDFEFYTNRELTLNKNEHSIEFDIEYIDSRQVKFGLTFNKINQNLSVFGIPKDSSLYHYSKEVTPNQNLNTPYIPFYKGHGRDLTNYYSKEIIENRLRRKKIIESLRILIPDIDEVQLSSPDPNQFGYLVVSQNKLDSAIPLAMFGDGVLKLFRILVEVLIHREKRLMIDEIDTGIHYSHFKDFWTVILKAARENNVQLFMTTHNEEFIRYFIDVLSSPEMIGFQKDAKAITLRELPDKSVKSYTYSFENLEAVVLAGNDVRGGAR